MSDDSSDSGDGEFSPGPSVTVVHLSAELSQAWAADAHLRERLCHAIMVLSDITGDSVFLVDASGDKLAEVRK